MMRLSLNIHLSEMEFKIFSIFQGFKNSEKKSARSIIQIIF